MGGELIWMRSSSSFPFTNQQTHMHWRFFFFCVCVCVCVCVSFSPPPPVCAPGAGAIRRGSARRPSRRGYCGRGPYVCGVRGACTDTDICMILRVWMDPSIFVVHIHDCWCVNGSIELLGLRSVNHTTPTHDESFPPRPPRIDTRALTSRRKLLRSRRSRNKGQRTQWR